MYADQNLVTVFNFGSTRGHMIVLLIEEGAHRQGTPLRQPRL